MDEMDLKKKQLKISETAEFFTKRDSAIGYLGEEKATIKKYVR